MRRSNLRHSLSLLIATAAMVIATSAYAQVSGSFRVNFGSTPSWRPVEGTRVEIIGDANHPYDMFRYGDRYYVYNDDRWYSSTNWRGDFAYIDENVVPVEIHRVPRTYWRAYPARWANRDNSGYDRGYDRGYGRGNDDYENFHVTFGSRPRWAVVSGTQVRVIRGSNRPAYDMFQYRGRYYVYNDGRWFVSRNWRGNFQMVSVRAVPWELRKVPRRYWRDYAWSNGYYGARYDDRNDRYDDRNDRNDGRRDDGYRR